MTQLPDDLIALLGGNAVCYLATTMPDGSPQAHPDLVRHRQIAHPHQHRRHPGEGAQRGPRPARRRHDLRSGQTLRVLRCPGSGNQGDDGGRGRPHRGARAALPGRSVPLVGWAGPEPAHPHHRGPPRARPGNVTVRTTPCSAWTVRSSSVTSSHSHISEIRRLGTVAASHPRDVVDRLHPTASPTPATRSLVTVTAAVAVRGLEQAPAAVEAGTTDGRGTNRGRRAVVQDSSDATPRARARSSACDSASSSDELRALLPPPPI